MIRISVQFALIIGCILVLLPTFARSDQHPAANPTPDYERVVTKDTNEIIREQLGIRLEEQTSGLGEVIYLEAPVLLKCRIVKPPNFNPEQSYPLVIGLHGFSSNPERFAYLWNELGQPGQPPVIFAVPQGPYALPEGPILGYSWSLWDVEDPSLLPKSVELTQNYIVRLVIGLKQHYKIDKTYLLGFSQGAAFAFITALNYPENFDGLISIAGWLPREQFTDEQLLRANQLKVFIGHGNQDQAVNLELAKNSVAVLKSFNFPVTFRTYECSHEITKEMLNDIITWILNK